MSLTFTPVSHSDVCSALDRWTCTQKHPLSPHSQRFIHDLREERNIEHWRQFNAEDLLPMRYPRPHLLLALRSAAVLLPILLTWLALSQVIDPFARYVQNVDASASFLWFWQTNPDNAFMSSWTLSHVALLDAGLLALMVVLSVRLSWHETAVLERLEREHDELVGLLNVFMTSHGSLSRAGHHGHSHDNQRGTDNTYESQCFIESKNTNGNRNHRFDSAQH